MHIAATVAVAIVALLHVVFMVLEMFLWTKPLGLKVFHQRLEVAQATAVLAMNQGLYNGFLAAGLIWALTAGPAPSLEIFFLSCVVIAGIFGAATASRSILWVQALPGVIALGLVLLAARA
jgi:putative membrane protein